MRVRFNKKLVTAFAITATVALTTFVGMTTFSSKADDIGDGEKAVAMLVSETEFESELANKIMPYVDSNVKSGYFTGVDGVNIYYETHIVPDAKGSIVISHGFTEGIDRYPEMIYYMNKLGYSVFGVDHRGNTRSGRLGSDDYMIYVNSYDDYVVDLKTFVDDYVKPVTGDKKMFLYAHSMGGLIGTRYIEMHPDDFDAAVLSSPMLAVDAGKYPAFFAMAVSAGANLIGKGDTYAAGQSARSDIQYDFVNSGATSEVRYKTLSYECQTKSKEFMCGGASYKWLYESYKATTKATSILTASKVKTPILLCQAGKDNYVDNDGQNKFAKYAKDCEIRVYPESKHEIYKGTNDILETYLEDVFGFYENNL